MRTVTLEREDDFEGWRAAARAYAAAHVPAGDILWSVGRSPADLFAEAPSPPADPGGPGFAVPRAFLALAQAVILHRDPERFALLYAMLLKLREHPQALGEGADPLLLRLEAMARSVRREMHKMRAFLRFRRIETQGGERFVAWFEPEHHVLPANAGFFVRRFPNMNWSILTPDLSIHWDGETLREGPGAARREAPDGDPTEAAWKAYYGAIFNPARLKRSAMLKEMPKRYWRNMPETALIGELMAGAQAREAEMVARSTSRTGPDPEARTAAGANIRSAWEALRDEAKGCTRCDLHRCGTQTVFGEGPLDARILFVGEQPGDQEDLAGRPFVGPAGQLLDRAMAEAGVERSLAYVTNAVKHFKWEPRGKRRIHQKPNGPEIMACRFWLEQERSLVRPAVTVALGATAARSVFGRVVTISSLRGRPHPLDGGGEAWVTVHPSFLLRVRDDREAEYARFVDDLRRIGERARALA